MIRGFYTSVSGLITLQNEQEVITNNIANINNNGYKKRELTKKSFEDVMISNRQKLLGDKYVRNDIGNLNPVIAAGIIHYELVRIHPFIDGNGRTGRVLAALFLYLEKFDVDRFFTLDEYYDNDRQSYYDALNSVDSKTQDLTKWLDYFLEGFKISITEIKDQILLFSPDKMGKQKIKLSNKYMKILENINLNGSITNSEVQKLLNISRQGAYKDLRYLMDIDMIDKKGGSRSTYYVLKNPLQIPNKSSKQ